MADAAGSVEHRSGGSNPFKNNRLCVSRRVIYNLTKLTLNESLPLRHSVNCREPCGLVPETSKKRPHCHGPSLTGPENPACRDTRSDEQGTPSWISSSSSLGTDGCKIIQTCCNAIQTLLQANSNNCNSCALLNYFAVAGCRGIWRVLLHPNSAKLDLIVRN